jgi:SAM-dependent methyltransferase/uncharacterized protein YbaR (Trm112 family)
MRRSTLPLLRCAADKKCGGELALEEESRKAANLTTKKASEPEADEVLFGSLICKKCQEAFPILAGVAIAVPDVERYLVHHVKGISKFVPDAKIPKKFRASFIHAKNEIPDEYMEEDLESDRVNSLYLMNHYLNVKYSPVEWWKPLDGKSDPLMNELVQKYWDFGPFSRVSNWVLDANKTSGDKTLGNKLSVVDLGCGVGGLFAKIASQVDSYLGVDSSFQSILLARHFNLGAPYPDELKIPNDLYQGSLSRTLSFLKLNPTENKKVDFVVGVIDLLPLKKAQYDVAVSMNTLDMLDDPRVLPEVQSKLLKPNGIAIQCGPYIWHEKVTKRLRNQLPKEIRNSAAAVEAIYQKAGFEITESVDHIPWLFFKHVRQLELYSVHALVAKKI